MTVSLSRFPRLPGSRIADELGRWNGLTIFIDYQCLPVYHFEGHLMNVHGVGIGGEVIELPNLCITHIRVFGDRVRPHLMHGHAFSVHMAEHRLCWSIVTHNIGHHLDQRQRPCDSFQLEAA